MGLKIPDDATCLVPGCKREPTHIFSLRMRRQDSGADWAPDTRAYFCTPCATEGCRIEVMYEPMKTGQVDAQVVACLPWGKSRRITQIR
jgi:hypothetical protein